MMISNCNDWFLFSTKYKLSCFFTILSQISILLIVFFELPGAFRVVAKFDMFTSIPFTPCRANAYKHTKQEIWIDDEGNMLVT